MASSLTEIHRVIGKTCWLALALGMLSPSIGQESSGPPSGDAPADAPAANESPFDDLYPDANLPGPNTALTIDKSPAVTEESAVEDDDTETHTLPELSGPTLTEDQPDDVSPEPPPADDVTESPLPDDFFSDLYPDVVLPGSEDQPGDPEDEPVDPDAALMDEIFDGLNDDDEPVELTSPRELLAMFDPPIDESQLRSFTDGIPLGDGERGTLTRIIYRLPRFSLQKIHQWQRLDANWDELVAQPDFFRTEFFTVLGRVRKITRVGVLPELEELLQISHYYRVELDIADSDYRAVVCTRNIPNVWIRAHKEGRELNERSGFSGMFLKVGGEQDGKTELVFATRRLAWFPDREDEADGVDAPSVLLGDLQVDVGLFELIKDRSSLSPGDREPFYQLLDGLKRSNVEQLDRLANQTPDVEKMLSDPKSQRGRLMSIRGNARRVLKIKVNDPDIRERFGLTHYYEITAFVPLDRGIKMVGHEGEPDKFFENSYPVVFCVRNLPAGMPGDPDGEDPQGPVLRDPVPVPIIGYYFKLYSYRSQYMSAEDRDRKQFSPLLIGLEPEWNPPEQPMRNKWWGIGAGALFVVFVAGIWIGLWWYGQLDREFEETTLARQFEVTDGTSLNELDIEASDGPDFSHLDNAPDPPDPPYK